MASENSTAKAGAGKARISLGQKPAEAGASAWKRPAVADRPLRQFTRENYPNSFRDWDEQELQEGNYDLAWFLREAVTGMVQRFDAQDLPNHDGARHAAHGMELAFDLLIDRMDMILGRSPMPFLRDVADMESAEVPDGWTDGRTFRMAVQKAGAD